MAAFYILAVDDREYKLKLTTAFKIEAEKRLGFSPWRLQRTSHGRKPSRVILWAALQKYHRTMTLPKVYDLIDEMEDNGCTISEKADLLSVNSMKTRLRFFSFGSFKSFSFCFSSLLPPCLPAVFFRRLSGSLTVSMTTSRQISMTNQP